MPHSMHSTRTRCTCVPASMPSANCRWTGCWIDWTHSASTRATARPAACHWCPSRNCSASPVSIATAARSGCILRPRAPGCTCAMPHGTTAWCLEAISGYRSHDYQLGIFERKLARGQTVDEILTVNAAPGYSEHHSGCALDIGTPDEPPAEESFEQTPAFAWLRGQRRRLRLRDELSARQSARDRVRAVALAVRNQRVAPGFCRAATRPRGTPGLG